MSRINLLLLLLGMFSCHATRAPLENSETEGLIASFLAIPAVGSSLSFSNMLEVNNTGGHLQGVQLISRNGTEYAIMSGSSSTYSYYAVARLGERREVIGIHRLLDKPYKHAGGFQITNEFMAIGVEDNEAKDRSKVLLYRLDDPESPPTEPVAVIERRGAYQRATAGCVALTQLDNRLLLIVGDWDSRHLDFYAAPYPSKSRASLSFQQIHTIDTEQMDRSTWSDPEWQSYQNINLLQDGRKNLYLAGMTSNGRRQDVADLYEVLPGKKNQFNLRKIASRQFDEQEKTKFRWGAGIVSGSNGRIQILSCGENLETDNLLIIY